MLVITRRDQAKWFVRADCHSGKPTITTLKQKAKVYKSHVRAKQMMDRINLTMGHNFFNAIERKDARA